MAMPNEDLIREMAARACLEAWQEKSQEFAEDVARRLGAALAAQAEESPQVGEELRLRTEELGIRNEELRARNLELSVLEEELRTRTEELRVSDGELRARTEELSARDEELRARTEELRARDGELRSRTEELRVRDEDLRARTEELRVRDEELRMRAEEIRVRDQELVTLSEQLRVSGEELRLRTEELAARDNEHRGQTTGLNQAAKGLRDGAMLIAGSRTQTETLETLLAASSAITPQCGLLILRGDQASGWSCNGLTSLDNFKRAIMDCSRGIAATVINSCTAKAAKVADIDPVFVARLGLESSAQVLLVPVLLKGRVAALLMGLSHQSDNLIALELLVQVAQQCLDLQAYRKAPPQSAVAAPHQAVPQPSVAATPQPAPPMQRPEPVVSAIPMRTEVAAVTSPRSQPEAVYTAAAGASYAPPKAVFAAPTVSEIVVTPQPAISVEAQQAHEKARRFAKLLVEEIKLYNQTKVSEGRARGDLYSRLRDDIEKSRSAYDKRYGESVQDVDYFTQELLRILADNNRAVMGAGFPG